MKAASSRLDGCSIGAWISAAALALRADSATAAGQSSRARVDGTHLSFDTIAALSRQVAGMSYDARAEHPCIGPDRADLVVAGCAILEAICRTWPVGRLRVADRGLREGILYSQMSSDGVLQLEGQ